MGQAQAMVSIDRSADDVWKVVGEFGGIAAWMPGIEACRVEGDDRIISMMGMEITERLVSKDDAGRVLTYAITDGVPVDSHQGVVAVVPDGAGSRVTWDVDATPDSMVDLMVGVYQQALDALKVHVER